MITDLDSSVAFEALYFAPNISILAYDYRQSRHDDVEEDEEKKEYHSYLKLFETVEQLYLLLQAGTITTDSKGKQFFEKKYGIVNGKEMDKIADTRGWFSSQTNKHIQG